MTSKKKFPQRVLSGTERGKSKYHIFWAVACCKNEVETMKNMISQNTELATCMDHYTGQTCLHWMVRKDNREMTEFLINTHGVSVNILNKLSQTPLHLAALFNRREMYNLLIKKYNADTSKRDNTGRLASSYLVENSVYSLTGAGSLVYGGNAKGINLSWHLLAQDIQEMHSKNLTKFPPHPTGSTTCIMHAEKEYPPQTLLRRKSEDFSKQQGWETLAQRRMSQILGCGKQQSDKTEKQADQQNNNSTTEQSSL